MWRKLRKASATLLGSSQYKLRAAASTAAPLANSTSATLRNAWRRARCSSLPAISLSRSNLIGYLPLFRTLDRSSSTISAAARRVATSAVALTQLRQMDQGRHGRPGIRSHRNFDAKTALTQSDAVYRFGM